MISRHRIALSAILLLAAFSTDLRAWSPGTSDPNAVLDFSVDTTNRSDVLSFYNTIYTASQDYPNDMDWTGDVATGMAGTTSATFKNDVQRSVNFYRALAGLPATITFDAGDSGNDQLSALITSANDILNHFPPTTYTDYTAGGATAAGNSNLALGIYGPGAIDGYMMDTGSNNLEVGHRRWILYPQQQTMGTGDVPPNGTFNAANALWIGGPFNAAPTPQFVPWPTSGYFPFPLMPARWSVSYPDADFTTATVSMTQGANNIPCAIIYSDSDASNGGSFIGNNTLVWTPTGLPTSLSADTPFTVTVSNIGGGGPTSYSYTVTLFDPNVLGETMTITGTSAPLISGATYTFNSIDEADDYDLQVSTGSTAAWNEGAEASPPPQIIADTTGSYSLIQSAVVHTGAKAFQLAFPSDMTGGTFAAYDFSDQSFQITRQIIPTATSQLQFFDLCRFALPTTTLSAQVSTDNGNTWTTVWSRDGVVPSGASSADWDPSFIQNQVSLSAYAGKVIIVQFDLSANGQSAYLGTTSSFGFFLDDITVTNSTQLTNITDTMLAGSSTSFALNATTAGSALQAGLGYHLRIRPEVGLRLYGFSNPFLVTPQSTTPTTGYSNWINTVYPTVTGGPSGDFSRDGISNGLKYAFGLNPTVRNSPAAIPQPVLSGSSLTLSFTAPAGAGGVTYGAQSSTDLLNWTPITDTGAGGNHIFTVNLSGPRVFMRQIITIAP